MPRLNFGIAIHRVLEITKPHLSESQNREVDALLSFAYENHRDLYAELSGGEIDDALIKTRDGKYLASSMDKSMHFFLAMYGLDLQAIKDQIDDINAEGLAPVKTLILPRPKVMGLDLEFEDDAKFPEFE